MPSSIFLPVLWPDFGDADFEAALERISLARAPLRRRRWRLSRRGRAGQQRASDAYRLRRGPGAGRARGGARRRPVRSPRWSRSSRRSRFWEWTAIDGASEPLCAARAGARLPRRRAARAVASHRPTWVVADRVAGRAGVRRRDLCCRRCAGSAWPRLCRGALRRRSSCCGRRSRSAGRRSSSSSSWSGRPTSPPISAAARFGGPKLWPRVSPKKTWSGALTRARRGDRRRRPHRLADRAPAISRRPASRGCRCRSPRRPAISSNRR